MAEIYQIDFTQLNDYTCANCDSTAAVNLTAEVSPPLTCALSSYLYAVPICVRLLSLVHILI